MFPIILASLAAGYVARKIFEDVKEPIDPQGFRIYGRFSPAQLASAIAPNPSASNPNSPTGALATAVMLVKGSKKGIDKPVTVGVLTQDATIPGGGWFKGSVAAPAQGGITLVTQGFNAGEVMAVGIPTGPGTYHWITRAV